MQLGFGLHHAQILVKVDSAVIMIVAVFTDQFDQPLIDFIVRLQGRHKAGIQRHLRRVAALLLNLCGKAIRIGLQRLGLQAARRSHRTAIAGPQAIEIAQGLFAIFGGHVAADVGLGSALELADAEQVHVDRELV